MRKQSLSSLAVVAMGVVLLVAACSKPSPSDAVPDDVAQATQPTPTIELADPDAVYDPVRAGESLPPVVPLVC